MGWIERLTVDVYDPFTYRIAPVTHEWPFSTRVSGSPQNQSTSILWCGLNRSPFHRHFASSL